MDLSKLIHGFVKVFLSFSRPLRNKTKLMFDRDFKACSRFCFELSVLNESSYSMPWQCFYLKIANWLLHLGIQPQNVHFSHFPQQYVSRLFNEGRPVARFPCQPQGSWFSDLNATNHFWPLFKNEYLLFCWECKTVSSVVCQIQYTTF